MTVEVKAPVRKRSFLLTDEKRSELARRLRDEGIEAAPRPTIPRRPGTGPAPLSFTQQRFWFLRQLDPASTAYTIAQALRIAGPLSPALVEAALGEIVRRHEALRTTFAVEDGQPVQVAGPARPVPLPDVDLSALPPDRREAEARRAADSLVAVPFDLARGPLLRAAFLVLAPADRVLLLTVDHIVSDGWSGGVLLAELATLFEAFAAGRPSTLPPLPPTPLQFADYAAWQRAELAGDAVESRLAWWRERLAGSTGVLDLPTDRPRPPVQGFHGERVPLALGRGSSDLLRATALAARATPFMLLTAALQALLLRYSGQEDVVVGSPVANRPVPELTGIIGPLVNTLVVRGDLSGDPPFRDLLARTRDTVLGAEAHQDLPFELIVDALGLERDLSRNPLFQVLLAFQNIPLPDLPVAGVTLSRFELSGGGAQLDLTLNLAESPDGLVGFLQARSDLYDVPTAARMAGHFVRLLTGAMDDPDRRLSELPLLGASERFQVLEAWNDTATAYDLGGGEPILHRLIEAQVARTPGAVAVASEHGSLDYQGLDRRANRLARRLQALGVGPESCVGVFMERSLEMSVALLGILKAGGAWLPLDPEYPADRLAYMVESSGAPVLLTQAHLAESLPPHQAHVLVVDGSAEEAEPFHVEVHPESPAYVIYTSGSTGRPKGVAVPHRGVVNRLLWMQDAYRLTAEDRVLQKTPFSFDVSVWELFWPLLTGARLVYARPGGHRDGAYLVKLIQEQGITTLHFVPSMLQVFLEEPVEGCRSLRQVFCSGEALPRDLQDRFLSRLGAPARVQLHNLYGPTEASVDVTFWACRGSDARPGVPIGRPIANTRILLLDRSLRLVPIGVPGELCIGGTNLARGYLGRPELTAERFVPDPFAARPGERLYRTGDLTRFATDGAIEYLGRLDHQVKVRGFRIELGEIEAALAAHPSIREAVVLARNGRGQSNDKRLVAYLVADGEAPEVEALRQALGTRLPDYMVPAAFVALDAFPLSPSGKVDRKALPDPGLERLGLEQPFVAPATPREAEWAEIWREVLGVDRIGVHDNFFALGGDSIRSLQALARARERGLSATLQQIFQKPTIRGLLEAQDAGPDAPAAEVPPFGLLAPEDRERLPAPIKDTIEDAWPLARLQAGMLFHSAFRPETAVFHDVFGYHLRAPLDLEALRGALGELAARHAVLRSSFLSNGPGEPLQIVHREVEIPLGVDDLRSLEPAEQAAALRSWVVEERRRGFDLARPPLLRFHVHRRTDESFQLRLSFHHALLDGWSVASLLSELFQRYAARLGQSLPLAPAPRPSYRDFVALEREALASPEQRTFWQRDLAGRTATLLPRWPLPEETDILRERKERRVRKRYVPLPAGLSTDLQRLASSLGVPVKSALLATHLRVLQLLTGQVDVITGLVANGRSEERDGERVLGLFLNTLPFRLELGGGTWGELVRQTFAAERERLPFRRFPLAEIQRLHGGQPLFETAFNFVSFHVYATTEGLRDLEVLDGEVVEETNFPLGAVFRLDPITSVLQLALDWDTDELHPAQVEALTGYYVRTLSSMAAAPGSRTEDAVLLAPEEIQQLVTEANDTEAADRLGLCVHRLFEAQAARSPESPALLQAGGQNTDRLTYGDLNAWANRLARRLRALGAGPETIVGLCAERSFAAIAGMLAVLKSGAAYLPLDPAYPPERLSFLLEDAHVPVLLCQEHLLGRLPAHAAQVVDLDTIPEGDASDLSGGATPSDPAYVIYTSGSTGRPKGVVAHHGGLANFALAMVEATGLDPSHRFLEFASLAFDASAVQIFPTLVAGAALVLHPDPTGLSAREILRLCAEQGVTVLDLPAALWRQLAEDMASGGLEGAPLSVFMTGGESIAVARLRSWAGAVRPGSLFLSSYGPTETTVTATIFRVSREQVEGLDGRVVPLGRRLPNVRVHLLDRHTEPVPLGVPGEVCIGGAGVTRGYLGRPDLTAQAFTPDPFAASEEEPGARLYRTGDLARRLWDGDSLEFLGRFDHQVKIRGFRVEPGEIEAALAACPDVADAAVAIREDAPGDVRLVAYLVPQPETPTMDVRAVRATLQEKLPAHMVPAAFVVLDALPVNANGKLDRQALPAPEGAGLGRDRPYQPPRTPAEERLAQVWSEVLRVERAGRDDNFFDLGGHSLVALQLVGRLREAFGADVPLRLLYETTTLAGLAAALDKLQAGEGGEAEPALFLPLISPDRAGRFLPFPLTPIQQAYWTGQSELFELGGTGSNVYNEFEVTGLLRVFLTRLRAALPRWIERHEMLRSVVLPDGRQQILERVPRYRPKIVDLRGLEPGEVRDRLEAARERLRFAQVTAGDWPPFEIVVFRLDGGRLRICARLSALVLDGTSRGVMMQDLFRLMADPNATLPAPELSFRDYAVARQGLRDTDPGRRAWETWMRRLPDLPPAVDLPRGLPRGHDGWLPIRPRFVIRTLELLDAEAWQRLRARAARSGLTPTGVLLAAFVDVLALHARNPRFTLSLVGSERFPFHPEVDDLTGNFNTIHLLEVDGWDGPFETRARRLRDRLAADLELRYFSGLEVLRELNRLHGNRYGATLPVLFNSVLEYAEDREETGTDEETVTDDSVDVQDVEVNIYAPQILLSPTMRVGDDGDLQCKWQAVDDAFPPGLIAGMAEAFERRVRDLVDREESWQAAPLSPTSPSAPESREPKDAEEEEVAALWQDILGADGVGRRDEFFAAGGDSLGVARLVSRLEERVVAADPVPRPGLWRRLRNRLPRRRPDDAGGEKAAARALLRERLMAAFLQEATVENLAAALRRERAARAAETTELAPAPLPAGVKTFTWLWLGQLVSMLGTGLGSFALGLWVYRATGSVTEFALISVFGTVASLLATPLAGALVDRLDRRKIMIAADSAAAGLSLVLVALLFSGRLQVWHVYGLVAGLALTAAFQQPAFLASVSLLVPRRFLGRANGMAQLGPALAQTVAPMIAGALLIAVDLAGIISIDLLSFLFGIITAVRVAIPRPADPGDRERGWRALLRDSARGWTYARERPGLLGLLGLLAAANLSLGMVQVLVTPLILSFASSTVLGTILSLSGAGMVAGSLAMTFWGGPRRLVRTMLALFLVEGVLLMVGGLRPDPVLAGLAALVFMVCNPIINASNQTIWQRKVPAELHGRVFSLQRMVAMSALPIAFALAGSLADRVFEPLLADGGALTGTVGQILGTGKGRGIGLMFELLGLTLILTALLGGLYPRLRNLERELPDASREEGRRRHTR